MKNIPDETDFFSGKNLTRFIVALAIFLTVLLSYIYIASHLNWGFNMSDKNLIGDAIGGISAPFIGITTCILTFIAFYVQYDFNRKQSVFIKKQHLNEFIAEFNQTFNLIETNNHISDTMKVMEINNTINEFIENFTEEHIPLIKKQGGLTINTILNLLNSKGLYSITKIENWFMYYNPSRKFIIFIDVLIRESSQLGINEKEQLNIINNFIIKFEIATTPEIINFLTYNVLITPTNVIKNKDFIIKSLNQHYGVNQAIFKIYDQIQNTY
ncbi:hypothetical protein EG359_11405 [Chryseobacterium joostei]|uniref:Phage abortive infection protein n=1 Tax=Chryseobacterium joostei TaxID=112234 RepID=A0A1N7IGZ6_9FLAO|nr:MULTISPECIES: hypothetical protein [Chryseobacterium]AZB00191.1 hypothetical protein EG359_11405 [Chryseobacterium joostei]SIS36357.1 hypothetical protein SAMN05421768_105201 [Chryseobacterium joostei]HCM33840.1 hypothetical protein [Chryseobacterium sp.]